MDLYNHFTPNQLEANRTSNFTPVKVHWFIFQQNYAYWVSESPSSQSKLGILIVIDQITST
jgi:hypothetical protein